MKKINAILACLMAQTAFCLCCSKGDDSKPLAKRKDRLGEG